MSFVQGFLECAECGYELLLWFFDCKTSEWTLMGVSPALKQIYRFKEKGTDYTQDEATGEHKEKDWEVQASILICPRCGTAAICRNELPPDVYTPFQKPPHLEKAWWEMTSEELRLAMQTAKGYNPAEGGDQGKES